MSSSLRVGLTVFLGVASGVACGPAPRPEGATLLFASGADLQSINPLVAIHPLAKQVQKHILFLTLAAYDEAIEPVPRLASWQWSEGRTVLRFALRRDVRWHDGRPTTADDVVWTLRMARHPETAYPRARDLTAVTRVSRVDDYTVELRFAQAQPTFPDVLTDLAILPRHLFAGLAPAEIRTAAFNQNPVGNGPFRFVEYRPNQRWVFARVDDFPESLGRPRLDRFVVVVVDESTTKLAALTSGELDFAGINPAHASFVRDDRRLTVIDYPVQFVNALIWNVRRPPFDDVRVRRAVALALDRQLLVDAYLYGFGVLADGPVSPDHPWFESPAPVGYDVDAAEALLEAVGWRRGDDGVRQREGRRLSFRLLTVGSADNALEQMIQAQLRRVGIEMEIRQLELSTFLSVAQGRARDFDALITLVPGDLALGHVAALFEGAAGPLAYSGLQSPDFEGALARVREAQTAGELEAGWRDAQRVIEREFPVTWLYHARGVQGVNRRVRGVSLDLRGELAGVAGWWIADREELP